MKKNLWLAAPFLLLPALPVSTSVALSAQRELALSALVTPLHTLPPMVPTFLICGPPT